MIYIPEFTSSFALIAGDFPHQPVFFAISFALFVVAFVDRVVVLIGPDTQLVASSFLDHTESFTSSAPPELEPSKFLAFYSKMKNKMLVRIWNNEWHLSCYLLFILLYFKLFGLFLFHRDLKGSLGIVA